MSELHTAAMHSPAPWYPCEPAKHGHVQNV